MIATLVNYHCVTKGHHSRDAHDAVCRGPLHHLYCRVAGCPWAEATRRKEASAA